MGSRPGRYRSAGVRTPTVFKSPHCTLRTARALLLTAVRPASLRQFAGGGARSSTIQAGRARRSYARLHLLPVHRGVLTRGDAGPRSWPRACTGATARQDPAKVPALASWHVLRCGGALPRSGWSHALPSQMDDTARSHGLVRYRCTQWRCSRQGPWSA